MISSGATVAVLAAAAFVVPPLLTGEPAPVTSAPTTHAPKLTPARSYASVAKFYRQRGPPAGSPLNPVAPQTVTVSADKVGTSMSASQVGLSLEAADLADTTLSAGNQSLAALLKGMGQPVLRFGGNSVDRRFFWTSTGEAIPSSYKGDKTHPVRSVSPADLERLNGLLEATGAKISLTVDLGHYNPARAADMMRHASKIFGQRLVAVTIGNEPNGFAYSGLRPKAYTMDNFLREAKAYTDAMYAVAPNVPVSGPGAYSSSWWAPLLDNGVKQKEILSFHYYPLSDCKPDIAANGPSILSSIDRCNTPTIRELQHPWNQQQ